jgi:hypothetical protein
MIRLRCTLIIFFTEWPSEVTGPALVSGPAATLSKLSPLPHQAGDDTSTCKWRRLAAFLLLGRCRCERTGLAHVVPGGSDPAIGTLHVRDAEFVDLAVEGIGDADDRALGLRSNQNGRA